MRILYVTLGYGYGAGKVLRTLISGMTERGHEVAVVSRGTPGAEWSDVPDGLAVYEYGKLRSLMPTVWNALREFGPDLIHGQMLRESTLAGIAWRLRGRPVPYLHREPGQVTDRSAIGRVSFRLLAHLATRIASPSSEALEGWAQLIPVVRKKGVAIRNSVDIPEGTAAPCVTRESLGVPSDAIMLLNVGSVDSRKNQKMIAAAIGELREENRQRPYLVVAGGIFDEAEREATLAAAEGAGIADQVLFVGYRDDIPDLYAACDIAVLSSRSESFGIALIEAMAAGKPVISTACGGPDGIVIDGETGFLVPVDDAEAMGVALVKLIDDPDLAVRMGAAGLQRVKDHYSVEAFCDAYEALYREMIEEWHRER